MQTARSEGTLKSIVLLSACSSGTPALALNGQAPDWKIKTLQISNEIYIN